MNEKTTGNKIKSFLNDITNLFTNGEPLSFTGIGKSRGEFGEYASEYVLNNMALTNICKIRTIHNVYVENKGFTTEIDVVAITERGIYVIESKNYGGWIFGSADSTKWTQRFSNGEKNQFYNPVMQNESHIKKLSGHLNISKDCFVSFIVFSDRCELKQVPLNTEKVKIIKRNQLLWEMKKELSGATSAFGENDIDAIYDKLLPLTVKTKEEKTAHVEQIKNLQDGMICPFCKKPLVLRGGQYGEFYGCTGYPECRFTRKK